MENPLTNDPCAGVPGTPCTHTAGYAVSWRQRGSDDRRRTGRLCSGCVVMLRGSLMIFDVDADRLDAPPAPDPDPGEPDDDADSDWERMQDAGVFPTWI